MNPDSVKFCDINKKWEDLFGKTFYTIGQILIVVNDQIFNKWSSHMVALV